MHLWVVHVQEEFNEVTLSWNKVTGDLIQQEL